MKATNKDNRGSVHPLLAAKAMAWFRALPHGTKAYLKEHRKLKDVQAITRHWMNCIATPEESQVEVCNGN